MDERMDCRECGQNVTVTERHTFVDCALYAVEHEKYDPKYARALAFEIRLLRSLGAQQEGDDR